MEGAASVRTWRVRPFKSALVRPSAQLIINVALSPNHPRERTHLHVEAHLLELAAEALLVEHCDGVVD